jgi:Ser/Thr protein kinase RdoA (MazF antagonist)
LESSWQSAADGGALLHGDLRADNILLADDRVVFLDWPNACVGAGWVDVVFMVPSILIASREQPESILGHHPAIAAVPDALDSVLAAVPGFFAHSSLEPAPAGLPTVRAFQRRQARAALSWLERRLTAMDD